MSKIFLGELTPSSLFLARNLEDKREVEQVLTPIRWVGFTSNSLGEEGGREVSLGVLTREGEGI